MEHKKIIRKIKRCHEIAHEKYMDCAYDDMDLSIRIEGKIKCNKLGATTRKVIGSKYLEEMLKKKYSISSSQIYLKERRKAITNTTVYVGKTENGLNLHSNNERNRGNIKAVCPIYR